jgi:hypothetical protein
LPSPRPVADPSLVEISSAASNTSIRRGIAILKPASSNARVTAAITWSRERRMSTGRDPVHHVTSNSMPSSVNACAKIWTSLSLLAVSSGSTA